MNIYIFTMFTIGFVSIVLILIIISYINCCKHTKKTEVRYAKKIMKKFLKHISNRLIISKACEIYDEFPEQSKNCDTRIILRIKTQLVSIAIKDLIKLINLSNETEY